MERAGREGDLGGLVDHSFEDLGVHVALVARGVAAQEVKVLATLDIPNIDALAPVDCDGQACVVVTHLGEVHVDKVLVFLHC